MTTVRALLTRVAKLEQTRQAPRSPFEVAFGSFGAFEDKVLADIDAGVLDRDFPLEGIRRMHKERAWGDWRHHRNNLWDYQ